MENPSLEDDPLFASRWLELFLRYTPDESSTWTEKEQIEFLMKERMVMSKVVSNLAKYTKVGVENAMTSTCLVLGWNKFKQRSNHSANAAKDEIRAHRDAMNEARKEILIEHQKIFGAKRKTKNKPNTLDCEDPE
jgi:hypothetical protein